MLLEGADVDSHSQRRHVADLSATNSDRSLSYNLNQSLAFSVQLVFNPVNLVSHDSS